MKIRLPILTCLPLLLAGCFNQSAGFEPGGEGQSLTLQVTQPWFWDQRVDLEVVMARLPDCQRRSRLGDAMPAEVAVQVFRPAEGEFAEPILVLGQSGRYYALGLGNCELQAFTTPPPNAGALLGTFRIEGRTLSFVPAAPAVR
ncbi:MAG TPA: hypothetical protein PKC23_10625 [Candidatus Desulfobacillus sp.]|nr:hypothetical protein [Candidatus Desulfobacillus sp.]